MLAGWREEAWGRRYVIQSYPGVIEAGARRRHENRGGAVTGKAVVCGERGQQGMGWAPEGEGGREPALRSSPYVRQAGTRQNYAFVLAQRREAAAPGIGNVAAPQTRVYSEVVVRQKPAGSVLYAL